MDIAIPAKKEKPYSKLFSLCDTLIITRESEFVNGFLEKQIQTNPLYVILSGGTQAFLRSE